jgi:hypothetical protein
MQKNLKITIFIHLLSVGIAFGCQCTKVSYTFMDKIDRYPFVALVEIIRKDTVKSEKSSNSINLDQSYNYAFTVVKILKQYSGKNYRQEIRIIDSKGFECFTRIFYRNIGDKFIVKGVIADINEYIFYMDWDKKLPKEDILVLPICINHQLQFDGNIVSGTISKNRSHRWWLWNKFFRKISFGLINTDKERKGWKAFAPQQMTIEKFERKLKRRIKNPRWRKVF